MKRGVVDFELLTDPEQCDDVIKKVKQHKDKLIATNLSNELKRLVSIDASFKTELNSFKSSVLSGAIGSFEVDGVEYHLRNFRKDTSLEMTVFTINHYGNTFTVRNSGAVTSEHKFKWENMDRIIELARFLIKNAKF